MIRCLRLTRKDRVRDETVWIRIITTTEIKTIRWRAFVTEEMVSPSTKKRRGTSPLKWEKYSTQAMEDTEVCRKGNGTTETSGNRRRLPHKGDHAREEKEYSMCATVVFDGGFKSFEWKAKLSPDRDEAEIAMNIL